MKLLSTLPHRTFWFSLGKISLKGIKEWLELVKTPRGFQPAPDQSWGSQSRLARAVSSWDLSVSKDGEAPVSGQPVPVLSQPWPGSLLGLIQRFLGSLVLGSPDWAWGMRQKHPLCKGFWVSQEQKLRECGLKHLREGVLWNR